MTRIYEIGRIVANVSVAKVDRLHWRPEFRKDSPRLLRLLGLPRRRSPGTFGARPLGFLFEFSGISDSV